MRIKLSTHAICDAITVITYHFLVTSKDYFNYSSFDLQSMITIVCKFFL